MEEGYVSHDTTRHASRFESCGGIKTPNKGRCAHQNLPCLLAGSSGEHLAAIRGEIGAQDRRVVVDLRLGHRRHALIPVAPLQLPYSHLVDSVHPEAPGNLEGALLARTEVFVSPQKNTCMLLAPLEDWLPGQSLRAVKRAPFSWTSKVGLLAASPCTPKTQTNSFLAYGNPLESSQESNTYCPEQHVLSLGGNLVTLRRSLSPPLLCCGGDVGEDGIWVVYAPLEVKRSCSARESQQKSQLQTRGDKMQLRERTERLRSRNSIVRRW